MATVTELKPIFGIFDYSMIPKLKRELRKLGVEMKTKSRREDDQITITFEPIPEFEQPDAFRLANVIDSAKLKKLKDRIVKGKPWTPKVGDYIYVETRLYIDHGEDDVVGGLAEVSEITKGMSGGDPNTVFVAVKQHPDRGGSNWSQFLMKEQAQLMKRFGTSFAYPDPDF